MIRKTSLTLLFLAGLLQIAHAQDAKTFKSPEDAVAALQSSLKEADNTTLIALFGDQTKGLFQDSDETTLEENKRLLQLLFEENWLLAETEDGGRILRLGMEGWPFPVPLVASDSNWSFDTAAGLEEIANRRVGKSEHIAIETCARLLDAEEDFRLRDPNNDGIREYTSRLLSTDDKFDGLYWQVEEGDITSPLQSALEESWKYAEGRTAGTPWFGYRFRFLTSQGPEALAGAYEYVINGFQMGGFAVVAYPANYGHSGVMTFVMNQDGTIYEKDLGEETEKLGQSMTTFNPGKDWSEVERD